jgi:hypothetical protein
MDDTAISAPVVVVSRSFARRFFNGNALGKRFYIAPLGHGKGFVATTIVGIAADVRYNGIEHEVEPGFYVPLAQFPDPNLDLIMRSALDPGSLANAMRRTVTSVDREQPIFDVQTMEERVSSLVSQRRLIMLLVACFAFLAALLVAVGVYGVFTYSLSQRRQEMGIRLALGASRARVLRLVLLQALRLIFAGSVLGIGAALLLSKLLSSMLVGVTGHDPVSFSAAWLLVTAIALLASIFPAAEAARTDLISLLRSE